jgi:hypothetical protein
MGSFSATLRVWNPANPDKAAADPVQKKLVPTIGLALRAAGRLRILNKPSSKLTADS